MSLIIELPLRFSFQPLFSFPYIAFSIYSVIELECFLYYYVHIHIFEIMEFQKMLELAFGVRYWDGKQSTKYSYALLYI